MNSFSIWFITGVEHITALKGYDHILFLFVLCGVYSFRQWRNLLVLVTAFTIGHSLTLALSVLNILKLNSSLVEFLIPVTIILAAIYNLRNRNKLITANFNANYWIALSFGLIHGLGFSNVLRSLLGTGNSLLSALFAFNLGLEAGKLIILTGILVFSVVLTEFLKIKKNVFNVVLSIAVLGIALILFGQRLSDLLK